jgi:hypothetical protein
MVVKNNELTYAQQERCIREVSNWASLELTDRFDKPKFNPERLLEKLPIYSPKLYVMLNKIYELDVNDYKREKKLYKHFIFSDIKKGYGAKIIASAFIAAGYNIALAKKGSNIVVNKDILRNGESSNFFVLSSTAMWDTSFQQKNVKLILNEFNKRPMNIYGERVRFIIIDSGFKEGIDLFDVKYAHIFEQQRTDADIIQAIGRGTRNCGQKGLPYIKNKGWELEVYNYKLYKHVSNFFGTGSKQTVLSTLLAQNKELEYNINFQNDLLDTIKESNVDYYLNENINKYNEKTWKHVIKNVAKGILITAILASFTLVARRLYLKNVHKKNVSNFRNMVKNFGKSKVTSNSSNQIINMLDIKDI